MLARPELDHDWIAGCIPHQGRMCLLDRVEEWDSQRILCRARSHRDIDNPLRAYGRLGAACGIEYAGQAMAVHGALVAQDDEPRSRLGYLVSVRSARLHAVRLDDIASDLLIAVNWVTRVEDSVLYQFKISDTARTLLDGRAAVVLNAEALVPAQEDAP